MSEWKSLAALAVDYLGMPDDAIPIYSEAPRWSRNAKKILGFALVSTKNGRVKN